MIRPDFDKCIKLANDLLFKQSFISTRLDVTTLIFSKKIYFFSIQEYCEATDTKLTDFISKANQCLVDGCTIKYGEFYFILHNDKPQCKEHLNWTRAHEIGHIYLNHNKDEDLEEVEAHFFAAQLLMPEYTLRQASSHFKLDCSTIMDVFGVSEEAALKRMNTLSKKWFFNPSAKDKYIWLNHKKDIELYSYCLEQDLSFADIVNR